MVQFLYLIFSKIYYVPIFHMMKLSFQKME